MVISCPHSELPLKVVLERLKESADRPFEDARPIPPEIHHSRAFLELEREAMFAREWICVGRADEIAAHGDYLTHNIAGVPIIVVRQADGSIKAFVNACAHRFTRLLSDETGSRKRFTCPYHAWTYDCAGDLIRAPYMEMKDGFDPSKHGLRRLQIEVWEGFLYVTLADHQTKTVAKSLAPLRDNVVGRYDMACYRTVMRESMTWNANWKNLIENFSESYHVPIVHRKTFARHHKKLDVYVCGEDSDHYGYHRAAQPSDERPGAAHPANKRLNGEWRRMMVDFCVFPAHLVTLMPDYLWYISVQPVGTDPMRATWGVAVPPEILADVPDTEYESWLDEFRAYMDMANGEDRPVVEGLHRGTASPMLPDGALHPIERNIWQFIRYLDRVCGGNR
ncbi:MAG: Rieske 2Fe-2S domain-containing protein [Alphaproteobacteria bacterium]|nr:Rieske 2Fe-2S domain-containing protein [Alphaproteobacteria bacterium]